MMKKMLIGIIASGLIAAGSASMLVVANQKHQQPDPALIADAQSQLPAAEPDQAPNQEPLDTELQQQMDADLENSGVIPDQPDNVEFQALPSGSLTPQSLHGVVGEVQASEFQFLVDDGQNITVILRNDRFLENIGLALQVGDQVLVSGFWEGVNTLSAGTISFDATGETFMLRDELNQPVDPQPVSAVDGDESTAMQGQGGQGQGGQGQGGQGQSGQGLGGQGQGGQGMGKGL